MEQSSAKLPLLGELTIATLFLLAIYIPFVCWLGGDDTSFSINEKRRLTPFPPLTGLSTPHEFSKHFTTYFQDHFGLREWLIHRYQREVQKRFHASSAARVVIRGRNGWLFFAASSLILDARGNLRFTPEQETLFWQIVTNKQHWLRLRNINYLLLVAPNKQTIYPEYLPFHSAIEAGQTRLDHLLSRIPASAADVLIDVRELLRAAKGEARLYAKSDTHWNYFGASLGFAALEEACRKTVPGCQPHGPFTFLDQWQMGPGGDLAVMLGMSKETTELRPVPDTSHFHARHRNLAPDLATLLTETRFQPLYTVNPHGHLKVLVLRDSFFNHLKPFASETFAEVLYLWPYSSERVLRALTMAKLDAILQLYRPDLVIEEVVERSLPSYLLANREWGSAQENH